jgi:flagellar biosynthesis/type III secretory pathway chaperone
LAFIPDNAIDNRPGMTLADIKMHESICKHCGMYKPFTNARVTTLGAAVGMDASQSSKTYQSLTDDKKIAKDGELTYLLELDDFQIEHFAKKDFELLKKLAVLGCTKARDKVEEIETESCLSDNFFPFLILLASCQIDNKNLSDRQVELVSQTTETCQIDNSHNKEVLNQFNNQLTNQSFNHQESANQDSPGEIESEEKKISSSNSLSNDKNRGDSDDPGQVEKSDRRRGSPLKKDEGTPIPKDFALTEQMRAWGSENTPLIDLDFWTADFKDYWETRVERNLRTDWRKTWNLRMRHLQKDAEEQEKRRNVWRESRNGQGNNTGNKSNGNRSNGTNSNNETIPAHLRGKSISDE